MRKLLAISAFLLVIPLAMAQGGEPLPEPGTVPGDLFYGLDQAQESISLALTFKDKAKAEKKMRFAQERLSESIHLAERGENRSAERTAKRYVDMMESANKSAVKANNTQLQERIRQQMVNRENTLRQLQERLPQGADTGLERALSRIGGPETAPEGEKDETGNRGSQGGGFVVTGKAVAE